MNRFPFGLAVIGIIMASACGPSGSPSRSAQDIRDQLADIQIMEIPIEESAAGEEPDLTRNVYFIFDGSGSMGDPLSYDCGGDQNFSSKLEGAKWAVRTFMEKLPENMNIGLFVFDATAQREAVSLGAGNREEFLQEIEAVGAGGGTPLAQSIKFSTDANFSQSTPCIRGMSLLAFEQKRAQQDPGANGTGTQKNQ